MVTDGLVDDTQKAVLKQLSLAHAVLVNKVTLDKTRSAHGEACLRGQGIDVVTDHLVNLG